jgi:hypothetical protein
MVMMMMTGISSSLVLAGLVDSGSLCDAIIVALPYDACVSWEGKESLYRFPVHCQQLSGRGVSKMFGCT